MPIFSIGIAVATAVGTFIGAAGAIGTFVLNAAVGIGMNLLAQQIAGKKSQPSTTGPGFSVQGTLNSGGDVPRSIITGWRATAGSLVYANTWGEEDNGKTPNAYLTQVIALADFPLKDLVAIWVNGERRQIDWNDQNDRGFVVNGYRKDDRNHLWVRFYDGTQTQADQLCVQKVSSAERPYEASRVGIGIAYVVVTCRVNDELFSGFPTFKFEVDGASFYDPSKDSSVGGDGPQRWEQPATWGGDGDHLPIVQAYNVLRGISYAGQWLYGLQNMAAARLPVANWIAQINKCRAVVEGPDGDEPTYRSSAEIFVNNEFNETIKQLLTSCQGRISEIGGFYKAYCGAPDSPVFSFTDDDIISTQEQSFSPFFGLSDTVNGITAKYPEPAEGWNNKPAPPIYRTDLEAKVGNRRLPSDVSLDMVPYANQVQRLMKEALQEAQRARRHTFVLPPRYWYVEPGDTGEWTSARNGYEGKWFRVDGGVDRADLDVMLDLTEVDPADYDYNYATDYKPSVIGPSIIVRPPAQAIVDFDAVPYAFRDELGLPRRAGIQLTWEGDVDDVVGVEFQVRVPTQPNEIVSKGRTDDLAAGSVAISQSLIPNIQYEVRGRYLPGSPRETSWSSWIPVTTPDIRFTIDDFNAALQHELDKKVAQIQRDQETANRLLASLLAEVDAAGSENKSELKTEIVRTRQGVTAAYRKEILAAVGPDSAIAQAIEEVEAAVGDVEANLKVRFIAGVAPGGAIAQYDLLATAENALAGMSIVAFDDGGGGKFGQIHIRGDRFFITDPNAEEVPIVIVDTVENKIYLNGDIILPQSITVDMLAAGTISAINAQFDTATITNLTAANIASPYVMFNGGGYNANTYDFQRNRSLSNSESLPSTLPTPVIFTKTFTTDKGVLLLFGSMTARGTQWEMKVGGGNWGLVNEPYRISATLNVKNNVGTVLSSTQIGISANAVLPTFAVTIPPTVIIVPEGQSVTVEVVGTFLFSAWQNNGGQEIELRWHYIVDPRKFSLLILEPYNLTAL